MYVTLVAGKSTIRETASTGVHRKPSQIDHAFGVSYSKGHKISDIFGKWMVFRHYDELDEMWEKIRTAIASDKLHECMLARCATLKYDPTQEGPGPSTTSVISVYTEKHNIEDIGEIYNRTKFTSLG